MTDELSNEAYKGILIEAERFDHDLTLQFGVLASSCKNEQEYLAKATRLIRAIQKLGRPGLSEIFFDKVPDKAKLNIILEKILTNISIVEKIPENKRHYDF